MIYGLLLHLVIWRGALHNLFAFNSLVSAGLKVFINLIHHTFKRKPFLLTGFLESAPLFIGRDYLAGRTLRSRSITCVGRGNCTSFAVYQSFYKSRFAKGFNTFRANICSINIVHHPFVAHRYIVYQA